jgi:phosphocarrier protein HPr
MTASDNISRTCIVPNQKGLHARAAAQIVAKSSKFQCQLTVSHRDKTAASLSLIKLLTLDAPKGSSLKLQATGDDAKEAIDCIAQLIEDGFGELDL